MTETHVQELLAPRYKVINEYPGCPFIDGNVYTPEEIMSEDYSIKEAEDIEKYPNIFRKLEWWEERVTDEMPDYVKLAPEWVDEPCNPFWVRKVYKWDGCYRIKHDEKGGGLLASYVLPATKEEYEAFLNQTK